MSEHYIPVFRILGAAKDRVVVLYDPTTKDRGSGSELPAESDVILCQRGSEKKPGPRAPRLSSWLCARIKISFQPSAIS